jgi:chromosome partitioning protein
MPRTIAVCARKGGAGKSTICLSLGCAAQDALLVDCDVQASLAGWYGKRESSLPECVTASPSQLPLALRATKRQWVIVDTPPHTGDIMRELIGLADFVLVPTRCSLMDLMSIATTLQQVKEAGRKGAIVLTCVPPGRGVAEAALVRDVRRALRAYETTFGFPIAPVTLGQRSAFVHSLNTGQSVAEFAPGSKAAVEVRKLWEWTSAQAA